MGSAERVTSVAKCLLGERSLQFFRFRGPRCVGQRDLYPFAILFRELPVERHEELIRRAMRWVRFDPRDMAEVRVFHREKFLCRAICAELAGTTIPLREILGARNRRRRELQTLLRDRKKTVDELLELKNGSGKTGITENKIPAPKQERPLKRYRNE